MIKIRVAIQDSGRVRFAGEGECDRRGVFCMIMIHV